MFAYRCYVCDSKLGDGIPPVEALSTQQNQVVGAQDAPQRYDVFKDTQFEGMSSYSFCGFCLTAITEFPSVFGTGVRDRFLGFVQSGRAPLGNYATDKEWDEFYSFSWVRANRLITRLAAGYLYRKGDFTLLDMLLEEN